MGKHLKKLSSGTVREIIRLAEVNRRREEAEEAERTKNPDTLEGFMERMAKGPHPSYIALQEKVDTLSDTQKDELLALMWLGRSGAGETIEDWSNLLQSAREEDEKTATLLGKSPLGTYLTQGLERLGE